MLSFIKLHVTNLMFFFVARFRKYIDSFVEEEVFLISFHYTQFANVVSETTGTSISAATIRCTLHQANLHGRQHRRKPLLKALGSDFFDSFLSFRRHVVFF